MGTMGITRVGTAAAMAAAIAAGALVAPGNAIAASSVSRPRRTSRVWCAV
jgi:hypothetical protein